MRIEPAPARPRRRINLTPMIDVVFLLLVFFMMVSRFGTEQGVAVSVAGTSGSAWTGPPRLIDIRADSLALNGQLVSAAVLVVTLRPLMTDPDDPVVLRLAQGSDVQDLMAVIDRLAWAGITRLAVVE